MVFIRDPDQIPDPAPPAFFAVIYIVCETDIALAYLETMGQQKKDHEQHGAQDQAHQGPGASVRFIVRHRFVPQRGGPSKDAPGAGVPRRLIIITASAPGCQGVWRLWAIRPGSPALYLRAGVYILT